MPLAVSSRASASSPGTRRSMSSLMMSATTFCPLKLTAPASGAAHVDVNLTAPWTKAVSTTIATAARTTLKRDDRIISMILTRDNAIAPSTASATSVREHADRMCHQIDDVQRAQPGEDDGGDMARKVGGSGEPSGSSLMALEQVTTARANTFGAHLIRLQRRERKPQFAIGIV